MVTLAGGALFLALLIVSQTENAISRAVDRWFEARHKEN